MKVETRLFNSAYKHIFSEDYNEVPELQSLFVMRNEEFGFQCIIDFEEEFLLVKAQKKDISRKGLNHQIRVDVSAFSEEDGMRLDDYFFLHLMDFVKGDDEKWILDILTDKDSLDSCRKGQGVFIGGKLPSDLKCSHLYVRLRLFYKQGYEAEKLVCEKILPISVGDFSMEDVRTSSFYTDLWQHPCNWARAYDLSYYEEEHMKLIDCYMESLSELGQKVCDLIVSDYPWAGQRCYRVQENPNNLFESNIVRVSKNREGEFICDFTSLDRYVELAQSHGMAQEINLFGILGNWDAYDFGNPLTDLRDPIRISYFDQEEGIYKYMSSSQEVEVYLSQLFGHLQEKGLWSKTLILSDEPSDIEVFQETVKLLQRAAGDQEIQLKCAIHDQKFFENYGDRIKSLSLNTCELIHNIDTLSELKRSLQQRGGTLTWYSCCFPQKMNIFLKSPLIECRLIGWFTYYMDMDGFLRWAYGVWPQNVYESASYKSEKWAAGDMFFVYPGKRFRPLSSLRSKNLMYGIQDYLFLKSMEKELGRDFLMEKISFLSGKKEEMRYLAPREVEMDHSLSYESYQNLKYGLLIEFEKREAEKRYLLFKEKADKVTRENYSKKGLSLELFEDNILDIDVWARHYERLHGCKGIAKEHEPWIEAVLDMKVIKLGRLQFELADQGQISEWVEVENPSDVLVVNVHIREGDSLDEEECERSYKRAEEFYHSQGYEFSKIAFFCDSWLLNPALRSMLEEESHILNFQGRYRFLSEDLKSRQMEERVFGYLSNTVSDYPEETSLQRALKKKLEKDHRFGMSRGYFLYP